jgi:hypothetical protein
MPATERSRTGARRFGISTTGSYWLPGCHVRLRGAPVTSSSGQMGSARPGLSGRKLSSRARLGLVRAGLASAAVRSLARRAGNVRRSLSTAMGHGHATQRLVIIALPVSRFGNHEYRNNKPERNVKIWRCF